MRLVKIGLIIVFLVSTGLFGVTGLMKLGSRGDEKPVIESDGEALEIPCEYTKEDLLLGVTASDEEDGDLTDQIVAGSFSRFVDPGVTGLTYVVFDSQGQSASLTREVRFTDYHPLVFREGEGSYTEAMERLDAVDQLDGSRKDWIIQTDTDVNYSTAGNYTMSVEVTNSLGDTASASLPVHVVNAQSRNVQIALTQGIVYLEAGEEIDPASYISGVTGPNGAGPGSGDSIGPVRRGCEHAGML